MKDEHDLAQSLLAHDEDVAVPADHERRIREGLGAWLAAAPPAPPAPSAPGARTAGKVAESALRKWMTTGLVAVVAAGGGFVAGRATAPRGDAPPASSAAAPVVPSSTPTTSASPSASVEPIASAPPASSSAPSSAAGSPATAPTAGDAFDREQSLLERARSALVRHDADAAEKALNEHDRQFPRSRHAEERDYLRIQVLRDRGDTARMRERAKAFLATYPDSMLRARVEPLAR